MKGVQAYQKVQVMTADGVRLVVMLYEGVIKFNGLAVESIKERDIEKRTYYINRSAAIISDLYNSLDMERGGEVAANLRDLYLYSMTRLTEANMKNSPAVIKEVTALFVEIKSGWDEIARSGVPGRAADSPARVAHGR